MHTDTRPPGALTSIGKPYPAMGTVNRSERGQQLSYGCTNCRQVDQERVMTMR